MLGVLLVGLSLSAQSANPDFQTVTQKLDQGGSFFLYTKLEKVLLGAVSSVEQLAAEDTGLLQLTSSVRMAIKSLGLDTMSDVGISVYPLGEKTNRIKVFLSLKQPSGIFQLRGKEPYELASLGYIPSDAVYAYAQNVSFGKVADVLRQIAAQGGGAKGEAQMLASFELAKAKGFDVPRLLDSLGEEWAAYLKLNPEKQITFDLAKEQLHMSQPSGIIMVQVKDSALFDTLVTQFESHGSKLAAASIAGVQGRLIPVPENNSGFQPVLAQGNGWLFLASHPDELQAALETAKNKKDLRTSADYQKLTKDTPSKQNGVTYVGPLFGKQVGQLISQIEQEPSRFGGGTVTLFKLLFSGSGEPSGYACVRVNDPQGILWTCQGDVRVGNALKIVGTTGGVPVLAAFVAPNFTQAKQNSQLSRVRDNLRCMALGIEAYYVDNNAFPVWTDDSRCSVLRGSTVKGKTVPSFRVRDRQYQGFTLTTPIAYISQPMPDPFSIDASQPFGYYAPKDDKGQQGWILFSRGPDNKFDLDWKLYDPSKPQPSPELINYSYDPTNGTLSAGDIFMVKQKLN